MLEIIAVVFLGGFAGRTAESKGYSFWFFTILFAVLWLGAEAGGFWFAYSESQSKVAAYSWAILGAIVGGFFGMLIPMCLTDRTRGHWKPMEQFDIFGRPLRPSREPARKKKPTKKRRSERDEDDYDRDERRRRRSRRDEEEDDYDPPRRREERLEEVEDGEPPRRRPSPPRSRRDEEEDDDPPPRRRRPSSDR